MTHREYGFLFSPPSYNSSIDYGVVLLEMMAIGIIAGMNFVLSEQLGKSRFRNYWIEEEVNAWMVGKTNPLFRLIFFALFFLGFILLRYFQGHL